MIIQRNIPLKGFTTFKVGGNANYLFRVSSVLELKDAIVFSQKNNLPVFILGGGSNILVSKNGFDGSVIKMECKGVCLNDAEVIAGAGESWDDVVALCVEKQLYGVENLSFIPGTVGGAVVGNIGAYGSEVKNVVKWVEVFNITTLETMRIHNVDCLFRYRESIFKTKKGKNYIVTRVCLKLSRNKKLNITYKDLTEYFSRSLNTHTKPTTIEDVRTALGVIRNKKFPDLKIYGTAGSFFRNPIVLNDQVDILSKDFPQLPVFAVDDCYKKVSLAWILDHVLHIKGLKEGSVGLFDNQPLVVVNFGDATAEEIKNFTNKVKESVEGIIKTKIIPEVVLIGNF